MPPAYKVFFKSRTDADSVGHDDPVKPSSGVKGVGDPYAVRHITGAEMDDPVILITGALTGIGRAAVVAFAKQGAKVVVSGRRDEPGNALAQELRSLGAEAEFINADVRSDDDVRALVETTVE